MPGWGRRLLAVGGIRQERATHRRTRANLWNPPHPLILRLAGPRLMQARCNPLC